MGRGDAEKNVHVGEAEIGIKQDDPCLFPQPAGEVDGDIGFADAALSGRYRDDLGVMAHLLFSVAAAAGAAGFCCLQDKCRVRANVL